MITGWKKLTRKEREHLSRDANVHTDSELKACLEAHRRYVADRADKERKGEAPISARSGQPVCWDCYLIAQKLGLDTTGLR